MYMITSSYRGEEIQHKETDLIPGRKEYKKEKIHMNILRKVS